MNAVVAAIAFLLSWSGVVLVRRWALRHRFLDVPNERSSHATPVPRGGGVAIDVVVLAGAVIVAGFSRPLLAWVAGALLIAIVSAIDDVRSLPTLLRLLVHAIAAGIVIVTTGPLPVPGSYILTLLWIVGLTNAFNFMDGIDGIAGGQAAVAGATAAMLGYLRGDPTIEVLGLLICAASLGFLIPNWSPASIFMGDVGSAFLGYSLAVVPLMSQRSRSESLAYAVIALWPFLFDSTFTFFRRLFRGENVLRAHRSHLYQRLVTAGSSHAAVSLLYSGMAAANAALAFVSMRYAGALAVMMAAALYVYVRFRESRMVATQPARTS